MESTYVPREDTVIRIHLKEANSLMCCVKLSASANFVLVQFFLSGKSSGSFKRYAAKNAMARNEAQPDYIEQLQ